MASSVAQPLETPVRADPGRRADDLDQLARHRPRSPSSSTSTAISTPPPTTCRPRSTPPAASCRRTCPSPPTYRKVNPADSPILLLSATSDTLPLTEVDDNVDTKLAQQISQIPGVAQVLDRRPAEARRAHPARSGQARRQGPVARGRARASRDRHRRQPEGQHRRPAARPTRSTPTTRCPRPTQWNDVIVAYRNGAPLRVRDIGHAVDGPEDTKPAAWADGKRGVFLVIFKQPGANVIDTVDRIKAALPQLQRRDPAGDQRQRSQRPHADHPRLGRRRAVHAAAHHRAGRDGDLRLPAQLLGDDHPERHRAAGAARRLRADVGRSATARQSLADGADHRGRLRGRRRHRHAGEHHPLHRGGREADRGRAARARARSASPSSRSASRWSRC